MGAAEEFSPDAVPTADDLAKAALLKVFNEEGSEVTFGSLVEGHKKTIAIFIRHFHCGLCQDYVAQIAGVRKEALEAADARLIVIGCGDYDLIKAYKETTSFPYDIYADPKKELYVTLGMTRRSLAAAPAGEESKSYVTGSMFSYLMKSFWNGPWKNPTHAFRSGDISQLGGEFVFEPGPTVDFVARMKHLMDHVEIAELMKAASVEYP